MMRKILMTIPSLLVASLSMGCAVEAGDDADVRQVEQEVASTGEIEGAIELSDGTLCLTGGMRSVPLALSEWGIMSAPYPEDYQYGGEFYADREQDQIPIESNITVRKYVNGKLADEIHDWGEIFGVKENINPTVYPEGDLINHVSGGFPISFHDEGTIWFEFSFRAMNMWQEWSDQVVRSRHFKVTWATDAECRAKGTHLVAGDRGRALAVSPDGIVYGVDSQGHVKRYRQNGGHWFSEQAKNWSDSVRPGTLTWIDDRVFGVTQTEKLVNTFMWDNEWTTASIVPDVRLANDSALVEEGEYIYAVENDGTLTRFTHDGSNWLNEPVLTWGGRIKGPSLMLGEPGRLLGVNSDNELHNTYGDPPKAPHVPEVSNISQDTNIVAKPDGFYMVDRDGQLVRAVRESGNWMKEVIDDNWCGELIPSSLVGGAQDNRLYAISTEGKLCNTYGDLTVGVLSSARTLSVHSAIVEDPTYGVFAVQAGGRLINYRYQGGGSWSDEEISWGGDLYAGSIVQGEMPGRIFAVNEHGELVNTYVEGGEVKFGIIGH